MRKDQSSSGERAAVRGASLLGLRVLELGHYVAAPFAARSLGDLGAEVIKFEPLSGDPIREWGARYNGGCPWWSVRARNKKCLALDLKTPGAKAIVLDLAARELSPRAAGTVSSDRIFCRELITAGRGAACVRLSNIACAPILAQR